MKVRALFTSCGGQHLRDRQTEADRQQGAPREEGPDMVYVCLWATAAWFLDARRLTTTVSPHRPWARGACSLTRADSERERERERERVLYRPAWAAGRRRPPQGRACCTCVVKYMNERAAGYSAPCHLITIDAHRADKWQSAARAVTRGRACCSAARTDLCA